MIKHAILSNSLSLLMKIQADGVGHTSGDEKKMGSEQREKEILARASVQVTKYHWFTRARDRRKSSKILPP
jgi:hypothetical protein